MSKIILTDMAILGEGPAVVRIISVELVLKALNRREARRNEITEKSFKKHVEVIPPYLAVEEKGVNRFNL